MMRVSIANRRDGGWWWRIPLVALIWLVFAAPVVAAASAAMWLRSVARDVPPVPDLAAWRASAPQTTRIVAADGSYLAEHPFEVDGVVGHRTLIDLDDVPEHVMMAVLAAEDVRFFSHHGVDYRAVMRAAWANYRAERIVGGASTITQQVARNLLPLELKAADRTNVRKLREALLARQLERRWNKHEILEVYLNFVFLGQNAYGVVAGARAYFDKPLAQLSVEEAAMLAALIQAPSRIDPFHNPALARSKRDEVISRMARARFIDDDTRSRASAAPVAVLRPRPLYGTRLGWYTAAVGQLISGAFPESSKTGGLVVETAALPALGTRLQGDALAHARRWTVDKKTPQIATLVWDHQTGYIEALIGGLEWTRESTPTKLGDQFDRMRESCRQPGSAWKPVVYGAALEAGAITPGTALRDAPVAEYDDATGVHWKAKSGNRFRGIVLAQDALASSLNAPAIDVFDRVGSGAVIALARRLGITSSLADVRPMALGASCVKPIELARAYAVIARRGWAVAPRLAVRVRRGNDVLFDATVPEDPWLDPARRFDRVVATAGLDPAERNGVESAQLLDETIAFQLIDMLHDVVERGTATAARSIGRSVAGKTGTTNDNTDAWFVGFSARTLASVWIGFDDPKTKLGHKGDGAGAALPLWIRAIRAAEGERPNVVLPGAAPPAMERVTIDRESGLLAAPGAPGAALWFRAGTAPTEISGGPGASPTDFGRTSREF